MPEYGTVAPFLLPMTENETGQDWEKISFEVEQNLAEQLAAVLEVILPFGLVLEKNYGDLFPHELESFQGPTRLYGFYPAGIRKTIQERIASALEKAGQGDILNRIEYSPVKNQNWATAWQKHYLPIPIGKNLIVVPTWLENPDPNRIPIWMDPGMAFGSGTHPTTQISLTLLEKTLTNSPADRMIDMGCGSGILAIGAVKLGVKEALGVDQDPDAVRISIENARANEIAGRVSFREGSVKEILGQTEWSRGIPLLAANIIAPVLVALFEEGMGELVSPNGKIILSGILKDQLPKILFSLEQEGFTLLEEFHHKAWVGLIAEKRSVL